MSHIYCPECGFQNAETANFCSKCGSLIRRDDSGETTMALTPEEIASDSSASGGRGVDGPALVVRSGGGRVGEHFFVEGDTTLIGRSPDCAVFLDDVTVSRRHAEITRSDGRFSIRDLGSLNGTFVNRRRIEAAEIEDDDELQIGKYRLTFLLR